MSIDRQDAAPQLVPAPDAQPASPTAEPLKKYHIWTIGCQMNVADSNHVAAELEKIG